MKKDKEIIPIPDLDGEEWKEIQGYNGKYYISNLARIKSFQHKQPHILQPMPNSKDYYRVALWKNNRRYFVFVHRLVAEYFVPNDDPLHKTTVDHIDGNKHRNDYKNLQWMSLSDNIRAYYQKNKNPASTLDQSKS